jgi:hypothetical protein
MNTIKRIAAGTLVGAGIVVTPAVAMAAPAFASTKDNVMATAAQQDAKQQLDTAHHAAQLGVAHAQQEVFRMDQTGQMQFHDDGGHHTSYQGHANGR